MKIQLFYLFLLLTIHQIYPDQEITLYALYTPSHEILLKHFFLPSIKDDFKIKLKKIPQECSSAKFKSKGWTRTTRKKVKYIIEAIKENMGSIFIFSDVDIQFFAPIQDEILSLIQEKDFLVQKVTKRNEACSGFFACKASNKTLALWQDVLSIMENDHSVSDQKALNRCLKPKNKKINKYNIEWDYLPTTYFDGGGRHWIPGKKIPITKNPKLHHANWTQGVTNKVKQLVYVQNIIHMKNNASRISYRINKKLKKIIN